MKPKLIRPLAAAIASVCFGFNACATDTIAPSTYANIAIDGSFSDWASVPLAYSQAQVTTEAVQYDQLYVANDANYLYIYFTLYTAVANPFTSSQNLLIDTDNSAATGYSEHGIGSDLVVQAGNGYKEIAGTFNDGAVIASGPAGLNYSEASDGSDTSFELRISLDATYDGTTPAFDNVPGDTISFYLETGSPTAWFPSSPGSAPTALTYTLAPVPEPTSLSLLVLGVGAFAIIGIARRREKTTHEVRPKVSERL